MNINKHYIYPKKEQEYAPYFDEVVKLSNKYKNVLWNVAGNIWRINELDSSNQRVTYSVGRSLISLYDIW